MKCRPKRCIIFIYCYKLYIVIDYAVGRVGARLTNIKSRSYWLCRCSARIY